MTTREIRKPKNAVSKRSAAGTDDQAVLHKCLSLIEAFRAIRRIMPLQHAYAFLLVALEQGHSVSEYAKRARTTQAVMTRILFGLGSGHQGRGPGYRLVQQVKDPQDRRRTQTFLTFKGELLVHEIARSIRSDRQPSMKLRKSVKAEMSPGDLKRDQWLFKLIEAGRKLAVNDVQLVVRQVEALIGHRQSKRSSVRRHRHVST